MITQDELIETKQRYSHVPKEGASRGQKSVNFNHNKVATGGNSRAVWVTGIFAIREMNHKWGA